MWTRDKCYASFQSDKPVNHMSRAADLISLGCVIVREGGRGGGRMYGCVRITGQDAFGIAWLRGTRGDCKHTWVRL